LGAGSKETGKDVGLGLCSGFFENHEILFEASGKGLQGFSPDWLKALTRK